MIVKRSGMGAAAFIITITMTFGWLRAEEDFVVAIVNGAKIYKSTLRTAQKLLPKQYQSIPLDQIYPALVDTVIDLKLSAADARKRQLHETEEFKKLMSRISDQMLQRTALQNEINKALTDEALQQRYENMIKESGEAEEIRARHILVKTENEAKAIIEELSAGANFEAEAKQKSTGPSGANGGELGFFSRGQMVPEFEKVAFSLRKGEITNSPVKTQFGWHIIKVEDRRKAVPPSFASVRKKLEAEISQKASADYVYNLRKMAKILRFDLKGKPLAR